MKVYILSGYSGLPNNFAFKNLKKSSLFDSYKKHSLVDNPQLADIIIFVEHHPEFDPFFFEILKHPIYKLYKEKCYLYHDNDVHLTLIPTISPSICNSTFNKKIHYSYHYLEQISSNPYVEYTPNKLKEKKYLFSFMGASRTYPSVRKEIIERYKGDDNIVDTGDYNSWDLNEEERDAYFKKYADVLFQSKFILCPRGIGPSSYRLFESMKLGIAPVIISDEWVEIEGLDWDSFSIRIKENEVDKIEEILKERENDYIEMGLNAKKNYDLYMNFENQFHLLSEAATKLHTYRNETSVTDYGKEYMRFLEPFNFRNLMRYYKKKYIA